MSRPILALLIPFAAGIASGTYFLLPGLLITALIVTAAFLLLPALKNRIDLSTAGVCLVAFLLGILNVYHDRHGIAGSRDISRFAGSEKMTLEGFVAESPKVFPEKADLTVETVRIIRDGRIVPVEGRILLTIRDPRELPDYGDLIRFKTKLKPPRNFYNPGGFDYERYLRGKGIRLRGTLDKSGYVVIRAGCGHPLKSCLEKFRTTLRRIIRTHAPSPEGEIIQAMILGEQSEIPREVMDRFNQTGTSHIIAISGFNIGIIAAFSFLIVKALTAFSEYLLLRFNMVKVSTLFAVVPIILYAFIAGFGISVVRATLMILSSLAAILLGKEQDLPNTLAFAGLLILAASPLSLFDVSFQLSFTAVASLLYLVPRFSLFLPLHPGEPVRHPRLRKALTAFILFLAATLAATLGAAPLIAYYFNLLSLVTLLANILIVPLMGYLVILIGMAVILTAPLCSGITIVLVKICAWLTGLALSIAESLCRLPMAYAFVTTPTLPEVAAYYLLLITGVTWIDWWRGQRDPEGPAMTESTRARLKLCTCLLVIFFMVDGLYFFYKDRHPGRLRATFLDVGQGNSTLIDFPGGTKMLIDGGGSHDGRFDTGRYILAPFLWQEKIDRMDIVVLSHPHPDHLNGLIYILRHFPVREVWSNGDAEDSVFYDLFLKIIREKGIRHCIMEKGSPPVIINGVRIDILHPPRHWGREVFDANDRSLVLKISYGKTGILFPGDISETAEGLLLEKREILRSSVLLAPHHGSARSSSRPFLRAVRPEAVIFSCGAGNIFRFPHPDALKRYRETGSRIFRTDLDGALRIETDGDRVQVHAFKEP